MNRIESKLDGASPSERSKPDKPWQDPSHFDEHEVQATYVSGGFVGIVLAGCVYPFLIGFVFLIFETIGNLSFDEFLVGLFILLAYSVMGGVFGLIVASITGLLSIALIIVMNRSLGYPLDARSASISAGSLAGYLPTAWVLFSPNFGSDLSAALTSGFLGPVLAMSLGAFSAAWASARLGGFDFSIATRRRKYRLSIMHIMIATAWISLTFGIANHFGGIQFALAAAGWFALQGFMLGLIRATRRLRGKR